MTIKREPKRYVVEGIGLTHKSFKIMTAFEKAAVNKSWQGAAHPDDRERIEKSYHRNRKNMVQYLSELENNQRPPIDGRAVQGSL